MSNSNNGYDSIANTNEEEQISLLERVKRFDYKNKHRLPLLVCASIVSFILLLISLVSWLPDTNYRTPQTQFIQSPITPGISSAALEEGLAKCQSIVYYHHNNNTSKPIKRTSNPRVSSNVQSILLKNAVIWDGEGQVLENVDILLSNGVISQVKQDIQVPDPSVKVIDVGRHIVSPGLVDMHTHLGVASWPYLSGTSDTNEETQPLTPFVRSIDAFNPSDKAIRIVASGGVTTTLVLPGSGNLMGGEAYAFKLRPMDTPSNDDMLVQSGIDETVEHKWRYMKMACGENPKKVYGRFQGRMPSTRLGEAFLFRKAFAEAKSLVDAQEDWCSAAENLYSSKDNDQLHLDSRFPEDIKLESLTALLRGKVKLNIHCYETHDIEAMIRHANEFNFNISAFHHALEAYRIPDIIKRARNNITVATFADNWGYKKEAFGASPEAPKLLFEAGIPVALKSDHPVLNSQHMAFEAAKAAHYGLPEQDAFKAITSVPAKALGLDHRVGSLKEGYDADVVIWDRSPLALGATPLQVFIDGIPLFDENPIEPVKETKLEKPVDIFTKDVSHRPKEGAKNYILTNIGINYLRNDLQKNSFMVVENGRILCYQNNECASIKNTEFETIDLQGGVVLPGLIAVGSKLGIIEMPSEGSTGDGVAPASSSQNPKSILEAIDGLKLGTKKLNEAYKGGVLTTISAPVSRNVVIGVSTAFKTHADSVLTDGTVISPASALHFQIGNDAKSDSFPTISSQIAFLRQIFTENANAANHYGQAVRGELPIIIMVNNKDEIASVINLKEQTIPKARLAIMGGAEAHLLAPHLAKANIAVILRPSLCTPDNFHSSHCLTGAPLTNGTAAHTLHYYGVKLGLGVSNDGWTRNLAWDAGWLAATSPSKEMTITEAEAIKFVTTNLQEIFGLKGHEETSSSFKEEEDFVVWSGSPMDMQSRPVFIHTKENGIHYL